MYNIDQVAWSNEDINVLGVIIAHEDLVEKNYQTITQKVKSTLNAWYNRGLTLIGKVQVINTLVASLFVYKMMVLPNIPHHTLKCVENVIRDFLWNGKKSKIAYRVLQNPKKQGGLNLVNLRNKEKALKATWPMILKDEQHYSELVYTSMGCKALSEDLWRCSISPQSVKKMSIKNVFWFNVLEAWSEFNFYSDNRIDNQLIWYNSKILFKGKPFMWNDIYRHGLKYVYQLFELGQFKTDDQVWHEFRLSRLRFNSIKTAIPKEWRSTLKRSP